MGNVEFRIKIILGVSIIPKKTYLAQKYMELFVEEMPTSLKTGKELEKIRISSRHTCRHPSVFIIL